MANIVVTTSRNFDDSANAALTNGATITINTGAVLTCGSDTRWGQLAKVPLSVTIDSASGGELFLEGRNVWWVPFSSATGTVPALGALDVQNVTRSGFSVGEYLGVFTALGVAPSTVGAAMPSSGFLKFRSKSAVLASSDVLTIGTCTATLSGAGQRGWLHFVGTETGAVTVPRLGKFKARGDWFELGTTSGSTGQTLQYYVADVCPALWIETAPASQVYEVWLCAGASGDSWNATYIPQDERGKFFGCDSTGLISLATATHGKLPVSGCRIRVPNIHISSTNAAGSYLTNTFHSTSTTRWRTSAGGSGNIDLEYVNTTGFLLTTASAYAVRAHYCGMMLQTLSSNNATPIDFNELALGRMGALNSSTYAFDYRLASNAGANLVNCHAVTVSSSPVIYATGFANLNVDGGRYTMLSRTLGNAALLLTSCVDSEVKNSDIIGSIASMANCTNTKFTSIRTSDTAQGGPTAASSVYAISMSGCVDSIIDGASLVPNGGTPPKNRYAYLANNIGCVLRNFGSFSAPIDLAGHTAWGLTISASIGTKVQRCFFINGASGEFDSYNSNDETVYESCLGGPDYNAIVPTLDGNSVIKGYFGGSAGFGGAGIPTISSSVFGTHFYDTFVSTTSGYVGLLFNEPTALSSAYVQITAGTPQFDSTGKLYMKTVGDQITYTWPHFILGYTGLANAALALNGGTGNMSYEYAIDTGSGFGGWSAATGANLSAEPGITAAAGFKLKLRITCVTGAVGNYIAGLYVTGVTDVASQQAMYPLDTVTFTLTGLVPGSDVTLLETGTENVLMNTEDTGGSYAIYTYETPVSVDVSIYKPGYIPHTTIRNFPLTLTPATLPIVQAPDDSYLE